jgi:hypothetical protein
LEGGAIWGGTTVSVGTAVITLYMVKSKGVLTTDIAHIEDEEVIGVYCHTLAHKSFGNVSVLQQYPIHWFSKRKAKLQMKMFSCQIIVCVHILLFCATDSEIVEQASESKR